VDWPNAWAPPYPGTLTVERAGSALVLPTLEGPSPVERRPELPPSRSPQGERASAREDELEEVTWRIEHDVTGRETRAVVGYGSPSEPTDVAPAIVQWYGGTVGVSTEDPGRAFVDASATYELRFPEARVQTASRLRIDSDAGAYRVRLDLDVREDDQVRWSRRWERRVPRNLQ